MSDTSAGGITGRLRLDSSDWDAAIEKAKADAAELGRSNPNVRIDVDSASAQAKLDEVHAVADALGDSSPKINVTASTAEADAELLRSKASWSDWAAEVKNSANASDLFTVAGAGQVKTLLALSDANTKVAAARSALNKLQSDGVAADDALTAAARALTDAQVEQAAAADAVRAASSGASEGADAGTATGPVGLGVTAAGIAALVSLVGPLTAEIVGLGGAFVGMGGAGVAAFEGIKQQIADGTQLGQQYQAGLDGLKSDLAELEQTAAGGVLYGFQSSLDAIEQQMPALNSEVKDLSAYLGQSGSNLIDGFVSGLAEAKPLLDEGAGILDQWTAQFDAWTKSDGFKQFLSFAKSELPIVSDDLKQIAGGAVKFAAGMKDAGNNTLGSLALIADLAGAVGQLSSAIDKSLSSAGKSGGTMGNFAESLDVFKNLPSVAAQGLDALTSGTRNLSEVAQGFKDRNLAEVINGITAAAKAAQPPIDAESESMKRLDATLQNSATNASALIAQLQGLDGGSISAAQTQLQFSQSVTAAATALQQNGKGLNEATVAGQANMSALLQMAQAALQNVAAQKQAGTSTADLTTLMQGSRDAFVKAAEAAGDTAAQANNLADQYGLIPAKVTTTITASNQQALDAIDGVQKALAALGNTEINIGGSAAGYYGFGVAHQAQGGPVFAATGLMNVAGPGSSFSDSIPAMLSNGESVVRAPSANAYPQFLNAYNSDPTAALKSVMAAGAGLASSSNGGVFSGNLYLDSGQFIGLVNGQIQQAKSGWDQQAAAGTKQIWRP